MIRRDFLKGLALGLMSGSLLKKLFTPPAKLALDMTGIYAPYVPIHLRPYRLDPSEFKPRRGLITRYNEQRLSKEFYGTVRV